MLADQRCGAINLDHGQPPAGGGNGIAFSCVGLLSNPQCVQLGLKDAPIDDRSTANSFVMASCIVPPPSASNSGQTSLPSCRSNGEAQLEG